MNLKHIVISHPAFYQYCSQKTTDIIVDPVQVVFTSTGSFLEPNLDSQTPSLLLSITNPRTPQLIISGQIKMQTTNTSPNPIHHGITIK